MNDAAEGSPSAARCAHNGLSGEQKKEGLFGRLIRTLPFSGDDGSSEGIKHGANGGEARIDSRSVSNSGIWQIPVKEIAIPRAEIVAVPLDISLRQLIDEFRRSGFSRLPVFQNTLDRPVGMVHVKDIALSFGFQNRQADFDLRALLRKVIYVPPSMPIGVLLQKMQVERLHLALIIDEYGGVDGLATIEDLVEQVVGDIADEHDKVDSGLMWERQKSGDYVCLGKTSLEEFESEIGRRLFVEGNDEEIDTLGGLVCMLAGRVPDRGEMIKHPAGLNFVVEDADPRRIKRLQVKLPESGTG